MDITMKVVGGSNNEPYVNYDTIVQPTSGTSGLTISDATIFSSVANINNYYAFNLVTSVPTVLSASEPHLDAATLTDADIVTFVKTYLASNITDVASTVLIRKSDFNIGNQYLSYHSNTDTSDFPGQSMAQHCILINGDLAFSKYKASAVTRDVGQLFDGVHDGTWKWNSAFYGQTVTDTIGYSFGYKFVTGKQYISEMKFINGPHSGASDINIYYYEDTQWVPVTDQSSTGFPLGPASSYANVEITIAFVSAYAEYWKIDCAPNDDANHATLSEWQLLGEGGAPQSVYAGSNIQQYAVEKVPSLTFTHAFNTLSPPFTSTSISQITNVAEWTFQTYVIAVDTAQRYGLKPDSVPRIGWTLLNRENIAKNFEIAGPYSRGFKTDLLTDNGYSVMNDLVSGRNDMEPSKITSPFQGINTHLFRWSVFTNQAMFDRIGPHNPDNAERYYQWTQVLNPTQTTSTDVSKMQNFTMLNENISSGYCTFSGLHRYGTSSTYLTASSHSTHTFWPVQFVGSQIYWSIQGNPVITELYIWLGPKPSTLP
jgi:hypothetical protein